MRKIQSLVVGVASIGLMGAMSACGDDDSSTGAVASGGEASVTIEGKALDLGSKTVACTEQAGKWVIAIGDSTAAGAGTGVGATLTTGDNPEVEAVGLGSAGGQVLGWAKGTPGGEATATKDGKKYTITGNVTVIDTANPTEPSKRSFEIKVTCS